MGNPNPVIPVGTQFKPGESGNPNGRPKGTLSLTNLLRAKLSELAEGDNKHTYADLLVRKTLQKALKEGDTSMNKYCYDRLEGMPKGSVDMLTDGKPIGESLIEAIGKIYGSKSP